mmetsp:Transcript_2459/g.7801  ORF Transcript_2459/g.7801 Transcript_2459/m.7801 type:complete len:91 (-) Transcript_2459:591-863(-)
MFPFEKSGDLMNTMDLNTMNSLDLNSVPFFSYRCRQCDGAVQSRAQPPASLQHQRTARRNHVALLFSVREGALQLRPPPPLLSLQSSQAG